MLYYNRTKKEWQAALREGTKILERVAKAKQMISYSDFVKEINAVDFDPHELAFSAFLGEIAESEFGAGRGMLTALVVHKRGEMKPGPGFYKLASKLELDVSDLDKCWIEQVKKVHCYWSSSAA